VSRGGVHPRGPAWGGARPGARRQPGRPGDPVAPPPRVPAEDKAGDADGAASGDEEAGDAAPKAPARGNTKWGKRFGTILSPEMQAFLGVEEMDRRMVVKEMWKYIKGHDLQVRRRRTRRGRRRRAAPGALSGPPWPPASGPGPPRARGPRPPPAGRAPPPPPPVSPAWGPAAPDAGATHRTLAPPPDPPCPPLAAGPQGPAQDHPRREAPDYLQGHGHGEDEHAADEQAAQSTLLRGRPLRRGAVAVRGGGCARRRRWVGRSPGAALKRSVSAPHRSPRAPAHLPPPACGGPRPLGPGGRPFLARSRSSLDRRPGRRPPRKGPRPRLLIQAPCAPQAPNENATFLAVPGAARHDPPPRGSPQPRQGWTQPVADYRKENGRIGSSEEDTSVP